MRDGGFYFKGSSKHDMWKRGEGKAGGDGGGEDF